ncbi:MAG: spore coat biosynthesis protein F, partial [Candidatus Omnitrophica bacterium]|nr:spore coat biosynthesis protein F [Candidatus Omnitrophota bacterium]
LWGDTPLIDPDIIDAAIKYYLENGFDCLGTCLDGTFPWGISLLVFPTAVLDEVSRITNDPVDRENVSTYIYNNPDKYKIGHLPCPPAIKRPDLRLVVDELPDLELVGIIFEHFNSAKKDFRTKDIVEFMDSRPELKEINRNVRQKKRGKYSV